MKTLLRKVIAQTSHAIRISDNVVFNLSNGEVILFCKSKDIYIDDCIQSSPPFYQFKKDTPIFKLTRGTSIVTDTYKNTITGNTITSDVYNELISHDASLQRVYEQLKVKNVDKEPIDIYTDEFTHYNMKVSECPYIMPDSEIIDNSEYVMFMPYEYIVESMQKFKNEYAKIDFHYSANKIAVCSVSNDYSDKVNYSIPLTWVHKKGELIRIKESDIQFVCDKLDSALMEIITQFKDICTGNITFKFNDIASFIDDLYIDEDSETNDILSDFILHHLQLSKYSNIV